MTCDVCSVFENISPDNKYIRALMLHLKLVHKQTGSSSAGCQICRDIEAVINEDRKMPGQISLSTLNLIREHIMSLHAVPFNG